MSEEQRHQLFEIWKRGAPFPEIAAAVNGFMQDARRTGGGADGSHVFDRYCDACEPRG